MDKSPLRRRNVNAANVQETSPTPDSDAKTPRRVKDSSKLNALLIRGLPNWVNEAGVLDTYGLAEHLNMSAQALYKQFKNDRIAPRRISAIVALSAETKTDDPDFKPLTSEDLMAFLD